MATRSGRILQFMLFALLWNGNARSQANLPPWQPGFLDIHHISTGRGDCAFLVFPDGTTMLIDAGDISETHARTLSERNSIRKPNRSRTAPEWIIDYIRTYAPQEKSAVLDYAVLTHFHDDHFGEWDETRRHSGKGDYVLTGIMAVGDSIPIHNLIDRGMTYPIDLHGESFRQTYQDDAYHIVQTLEAYQRFIDWHAQHNALVHAPLIPGVKTQIVQRYHPEGWPTFSVRNIAAHGSVWTGFAEGDTFSVFSAGAYPGENPLSACLRISYGKFDYFTGGDISGVDAFGETNLSAMESYVAPVVGPVDVATLNHHGNRDSQNSFYVRTLRPRVWIGQTWSSDHPGDEVLRRIASQELYPGPRDIFCTDMLEANRQVIGERIDRIYGAQHGHIVVRVAPGGEAYSVYILDDTTPERSILSTHGPYQSR